jgi:hypothetical protein
MCPPYNEQNGPEEQKEEYDNSDDNNKNILTKEIDA